MAIRSRVVPDPGRAADRHAIDEAPIWRFAPGIEDAHLLTPSAVPDALPGAGALRESGGPQWMVADGAVVDAVRAEADVVLDEVADQVELASPQVSFDRDVPESATVTAAVQPSPVPSSPARDDGVPHGSVAAAAGLGFGDGDAFADVVRPRRAAPQHGWRAAVHVLTGGRWNLGLSAVEARRRDQVRRIATPLPGPHSVVVGSIKGGVGKTTVTAALGLALAECRGDRVVAIDANPDAGTLGDRLVGEARAGKTTVRDLLRDLDQVQSSTQLAGYTHLAGRLRVVTSEQEPELSEMFSADDYEAVLRTLAVYHEVLLTDCGTGLVHSAMQGTLKHADSLVVVGAPTKDGASRAARTLQWLATHHDPNDPEGSARYQDLVRDAVVVLSCDRHSPEVDGATIRDWFGSRVRAVVELPADPHLATGDVIDLGALTAATRDAVLELSAVVAEGFQGRPTHGLAAHGFRPRSAAGVETGAVRRAGR
ncbi:MinD/ParA family protein [Pseudonocardia sp. EV170527-09]|uniref:MinD/ParA family ATP-binding protein n=1 Tax=Pseudonocardia sp. EV170527-09 TaxID=2603411 RepID=UPI001F01C1FF|nr:MinD/ParA family protein [Pseudonocardia sp. EV170527-09]